MLKFDEKAKIKIFAFETQILRFKCGNLDFCFGSITLPVICIHHKGEQIFMCLLAALLQWKNPIPPTIHFWHHFSPWSFEYQSLSNLDYKQGFFPSTLFPLRVGQDIEKLEHPQQKISKMKKVFLLTLYYLSWQSNFELESVYINFAM